MSETPIESIARASRRMAWLVAAVFWLFVPALALYVLLLPEQLPYHSWIAMAGLPPRPLPGPVSLAVWAALTVAALPALWGLWSLKRLFQGYAAGAIFTVAAARQLRQCALALMVLGLETPFCSMLLSLALSFDLPPGSRSLVLSLSSNDLTLLIIGGLLLVIARIMGEAARLAEENAGFV